MEAWQAAGPSADEAYCAWFGDVRDGVLFFGESAFWAAKHAAGGDPRGELESPGPQRVGRFDLARRRLLPPLPSPAGAPRGGTWDVLAHPNGRIYFTTFFEPSGWVEPGGRGRLLGPETVGLNELALGPDGTVLATRYGEPGPGAVVVLDPGGKVVAEHPIAPPGAGWLVAAKSLSYDPVRGEVWVNTDLLGPDGAIANDARVLELASGRELARIERPELHFVRFEPDGRGHFVWVDGARLWLETRAPGAAGPGVRGPAETAVLVDDAFSGAFDFVQELSVAPDGSLVATRWSGLVHVLSPAGDVRTVRLPRLPPPGVYYSAFVTADGAVCATYCSGVTVVCAELPAAGPRPR